MTGHRLDRRACHPDPRRSQRDPRDFHHGLEDVLSSPMSAMKEHRGMLIGFGLLLVALGTIYYLYSLERRHQLEVRETDRRDLDVESSVLEERSTGDVKVMLYFYRPGAIAVGSDLLLAEERSIFETEDVILNARQIVNEIIKGPQDEAAQVLSAQARLRQIYLLNDGTAVVDLSKESSDQLPGGMTSELAVLYSITRSLIENITEIKRVKFLVEGQDQPTFAGHVSIREPFM